MSEDKEIKAISAILASLEGLEASAQERVFKYVTERLGIQNNSSKISSSPSQRQGLPVSLVQDEGDKMETPSSEVISDIRSLRDLKKPETAIQMAVLVAYYLQEMVSPEERKESIGVEDIQKYFKQAGFALPKIPISALKNAKASGYLESADRGTYKLNPVGYNLIVHGLPAKAGAAKKKRTQTKAKKAKKTKKK